MLARHIPTAPLLNSTIDSETFPCIRSFRALTIMWLCRVSRARETVLGIPPARTAESLGLLQGEVGVEFSNADRSICARVHSIKTAEFLRTVSTRRPVDAFDRHSLFVYGDNDKQILFTAWAGKILGYSPVDWRRRTTWFTEDLARRSLAGDLALKEFVMMCPTKDIIAAAKATVRARSTTTQPEPTSSPMFADPDIEEFIHGPI